MNLKLIVILVASGLALLFIVQNVATVEIQFLFWSTRMPRSLLIILLLGSGFALGWFLNGHLRQRRNRS